ncbi:MAG: YafY family transcriptional regulator [Lachnospiraceae bacterium]|nr:YafY family transcriptional regulator [Lachnospiraceae bacterium]MDY3730941.1 YafY family protein [Candidatus Choladocola sp.]
MKIDRLIGILSILLQKKKTTALELAERFEVSRRTINRDIENLCKAGIPIQTSQGAGGGISIMEGFAMERTLLTSKDMKMILAGLRSLDSVSGSHYYGQLMEKIKPGSSDIVTGSDAILIDLSSWNKDAIAPKVSFIQDAIEERTMLAFDYYAPSGDSHREIEPYYLIFKWSSWYVYGFCLMRQDFRMFKLNRMSGIRCIGRHFEMRSVQTPDLSIGNLYPPEIKVTAIVEARMKWRLIEEFGSDCFTIREDGRLLFSGLYSDEDSLLAWILTFGDQIKLLEPDWVKEKLLHIANKITIMYGDD